MSEAHESPCGVPAGELVNLRVRHVGVTMSPLEHKRLVPLSSGAAATVRTARRRIEDVLEGQDRRLMVIVGPCSIHDTGAALEYASRLKRLADSYDDRLLILMRAYFEKPRTTTGWKGLLNEPMRDGRCDIDAGRQLARRFLLELAETGMPAATEFLDPNTPQFLDDLIAWVAIGARTAESQTHREMAAGLSPPVGVKNSTGGSVDIAVNAILAARHSHTFVGMDENGREGVYETQGNPYGHLILRGGSGGPNYGAVHIADARELLLKRGLPERILVDCSHANAGGDYRNQAAVLKTVLAERVLHPGAVIGVMLESNLLPGKQDAYGADVLPGRSVTDGCIGWEETEELLQLLYERCA